MNKIKIESGIPLETSHYSRFAEVFSKMNIGDSFFIQCENIAIRSERASMSGAANYFSKKNGKVSFSVRAVDGGVRCWRIK